jgi:hypothetical protein
LKINIRIGLKELEALQKYKLIKDNILQAFGMSTQNMEVMGRHSQGSHIPHEELYEHLESDWEWQIMCS